MTSLKYKEFLNGFQVIYEKPNSVIPISSVQVFCNIGNIHAPPELRGVTHFIEHMCFKGTNHNPDFNKVLLQYSDIGAEYNASSFQRYTMFNIKCQDMFLNQCIKLLADELLNSKFDKALFKKEEQVVMEENSIHQDDPKSITAHATNALLYENTPFQFPTDDISYHNNNYNYADVLQFYKQHYVPSNMILSVTSNLAFNSVLNMVKTTPFNKKMPFYPTLHSQMLPYLLTPPRMNGIKYDIKHLPKINSIFLNISFQTCNQYAKEKYVLLLLSNILCNSLTSRLSRILRQDHGLVYGISASADNNECGGDFVIASQFHADSFLKKHKPSVLPLIIKELNNLIHTGITQGELKTFKHNARGRLLLQLENIDSQTGYNGFSLLYKAPEEIVPYHKIYKTCYEPITRAQINASIRTYFRKERMCVVVAGNKIPALASIAAECEKLH